MNLPRSTYYYRPAAKAEGITDVELTAIIEDIQNELPCYGYRRVTHELRRHGFTINHKRVARVMRLAGLGMKPRRRFTLPWRLRPCTRPSRTGLRPRAVFITRTTAANTHLRPTVMLSRPQACWAQ